MLINVFNKDTATSEKIESSKIDTKKHFHVNSRNAFTKEELESFKDTTIKSNTTKVKGK